MTILTPSPLLHALAMASRVFRDQWAELRRRRIDRQILAEMGPRELRDLGLGRDQIDYVTAPTMASRWAE